MILFAGCGGGYDIFGALPLVHDAVQKGQRCVLLNLSFTEPRLLLSQGEQIAPSLFRVTGGDSTGKYFPEMALSRELKQAVYAVRKDCTVREIRSAYEALLQEEGPVEGFYLVDGGCDVLLTGRESFGLATPVEDMMHLKAVLPLNLPKPTIIAVGVDVDTADGVSPADLANRLETLDILWERVLDLRDPAAKFYYDVLSRCEPERSIVQSLVMAAMDGHRGFHTPHAIQSRVGESKVCLGLRTCTMFAFDLRQVASQVAYLELLGEDMDSDQVDDIVMNFHSQFE